MKDLGRLHWAKNMTVRTTCLDSSDNFEYGAYKWTVPLFTKTNRAEKILLPIFWGLMTLRSYNIKPFSLIQFFTVKLTQT